MLIKTMGYVNFGNMGGLWLFHTRHNDIICVFIAEWVEVTNDKPIHFKQR